MQLLFFDPQGHPAHLFQELPLVVSLVPLHYPQHHAIDQNLDVVIQAVVFKVVPVDQAKTLVIQLVEDIAEFRLDYTGCGDASGLLLKLWEGCAGDWSRCRGAGSRVVGGIFGRVLFDLPSCP